MNEGIELRQYPDPVHRVSYPPLPRRGGNPNAVASDAIVASVVAGLPNAPVLPLIPPMVLPNDPEIEQMHAAGWL